MLHVDFVSWICVKYLLQAEILSFPFERSLRHIHIVKTHKLVCNQTEILCSFIAEKIIRQIACLYQRKAWFGKKKIKTAEVYALRNIRMFAAAIVYYPLFQISGHSDNCTPQAVAQYNL